MGLNLSRRFFAYLIDWYLGGLATAFPVAMLSMSHFQSVTNQNIMAFPSPYNLAAGVLGILCGILYYFAVPAFVWSGQTLGKRWMKLEIVSGDGSQVSVKQLFLRQCIGMILVEGSLVSASALLHQLLTVLTGIDFVKPLTYVGMALSIGSAVLILVKENRALHDYMANTRVCHISEKR